MGVGAGLYMYVVVVQNFTFAISSPDEFLFCFLLPDVHVIARIPAENASVRVHEYVLFIYLFMNRY